MANAKYTPDGLPVVSIENLVAFRNLATRISGEPNEEHPFLIFTNRLRNENPHLFGMFSALIETIGRKNPDDYETGFFYGLSLASYLVYESLRRQSEANKLEKELGSK